jgi:hypothetical protein
VIAVVTPGLVLSLGALTTLYSQNAFAQNSDTGSANGGISGAGGAYASADSGAGGAPSGKGGYNSNGGFALGGSIAQSGAGVGSTGPTIGTGSEGQRLFPLKERRYFMMPSIFQKILISSLGIRQLRRTKGFPTWPLSASESAWRKSQSRSIIWTRVMT